MLPWEHTLGMVPWEDTLLMVFDGTLGRYPFNGIDGPWFDTF